MMVQKAGKAGQVKQAEQAGQVGQAELDNNFVKSLIANFNLGGFHDVVFDANVTDVEAVKHILQAAGSYLGIKTWDDKSLHLILNLLLERKEQNNSVKAFAKEPIAVQYWGYKLYQSLTGIKGYNSLTRAGHRGGKANR